MIEAQILMSVSNFSEFFSRNHFLEEGFISQWGGGGSCFSDEGASILSGGDDMRGGHWFRWGGFQKNRRMGGN